MSSKSKTANALTVLSLMVLAGSAMAQGPAMGNGRALEADLSASKLGNVPRPNFMNEVRARNALVTGNAPGGRSLMINTPYSDTDDFRGQLGTDDLFRFRRDSIQSAPGFRGTQGLQYQSAFTIGNTNVPAVITRLDAYGAANELPRSGLQPRRELPAERLTTNPYAARRDDLSTSMKPPELTALEAPLTPVGTLRSTGAFTSTMGLAPAMVGTEEAENGKGPVRNVTASSLMGLRVLPDRNAQELSESEARGMTAREQADWQPPKNENSAAGPDMRAGGPDQSAATPAFRTSYDDLRMRLDEQAKAKPSTAETKAATRPGEETPRENIPEWQRRVNVLREQMEQERKDQEQRAPKAAEPEEETPKTNQPGKPSKEDLKPDLKPGSKTPDQLRKERDESRLKKTKDEQDRRRRALGGMDNETLDLIKKAGGEAHSYTAGTPGSLFDVHVRAGEEALKKGQYFDAEERFARALSMRPGDVTVMAARLNSQIGAGLYLSAAVNLRQLLELHPEMIGVRYTGATMPPQSRLTILIQEFRKAIEKAKADNLPVPEESALLLAYIGFQAKDQAAVRDGLDTLVASPSGKSDTLLPVLRRVWLEDAVDLMK